MGRPVACLLLAAVVAALVPAAGCVRAAESDAALPGDDDGDDGGRGPGEAAECSLALDCVPASSTCCECPSFAVPVSADFADSCDAVECPPADSCAAVEATCSAGRCELLCAPVVTEMVCPMGFARDDLGCLVDECATSPGQDDPSSSCRLDADCVQVAADCCGCAMGGDDIAVALSEVEVFTEGLGCLEPASCPGVDVCDPSLEPRCIVGHCTLAAGAGTDGLDPGGAAMCGTPDYPGCPDGSLCLLNVAEAKDAAALGVGVCQVP